MKQHQKQDLHKGRRAFVGAALTAGGGAVVAAVVPGAAVSADLDPADTEPESRGYQLTEHVLDYYKSAAE